MSDHSAIAWTEGMFLRPQHFQQAERSIRRAINHSSQHVHHYPWGTVSLEIDQSLLPLGQVRLSKLTATLADGTAVDMPTIDPLPQALSLTSEVRDEVIYLAIASDKTNGTNISADGDGMITRYRFADHTCADVSLGSDAQESVQIAALHSQLKRHNDDRAGYICLPIARVIEVSDEGNIKLDSKFIAPTLNAKAVAPLTSVVREIHGMIKQRAEALSARLTQGQAGSTSVADFMMLQVLNKYQPVFSNFENMDILHPFMLYNRVIELVGELSTFSTRDKRVPELPHYNHSELTAVFGNLMVLINQTLSQVLEQTALEIPLEKSKFGIYFGAINDKSLLDNAHFILAVKANLPNEEVRQRLPAQTKIGSVETIRDLVNNQIPGITLATLPVAPRQVPYHAGYHYFQLEKGNEHWLKLSSSGGIALHISGNYPELQVALWAVKG
ncbi:type VI secretion system baseplate subunit TssK [Pseudoalteromonas ruthenica]|uniref:type VI secretion system baseplate subunit TssK n=1 Tax=Pseudoalteromonas ruthenica TaxID=151081 RepID=UPI00034BC7C9|nr:type VI secretion system baseplate subunit TssK [Pseudoalteromonas ruthenica]